MMKSMIARAGLMLSLAACTLVLGACQTAKQGATSNQSPEDQALLAALPKADAALEPLSFMAGRWIGINPNKTINEEHWMLPRGTSMMGMFRQIRRDLKPAFFETTQIVLEDDQVVLRMRHLHRQFEVPDNAKEAYSFKLEATEPNKASFVGIGNARGTKRVTYRLVNANELAVDVELDPEAKAKDFTTVYRREPVNSGAMLNR